MSAIEGLQVEELALEDWLRAAFHAERSAAVRPRAMRSAQPIAPARRPRLLVGARRLYWSWFAGAALSLLLQVA